jgi:hypothetical protein
MAELIDEMLTHQALIHPAELAGHAPEFGRQNGAFVHRDCLLGVGVNPREYPYSDTSRTYAINTRIYRHIKGRFPSSLATAKPRFYVSKFGQRTKVTL